MLQICAQSDVVCQINVKVEVVSFTDAITVYFTFATVIEGSLMWIAFLMPFP